MERNQLKNGELSALAKNCVDGFFNCNAIADGRRTIAIRGFDDVVLKPLADEMRSYLKELNHNEISVVIGERGDNYGIDLKEIKWKY